MNMDTQLPPPTITLSAAGARRIAQLAEKEGQANLSLRLSVLAGGCSGFQYEFKLETAQQADDLVITQDGRHLLIDPVSLGLLGGAVIDYIDTLAESRFVVVNPNAASSCGCGTSFAPKF